MRHEHEYVLARVFVFPLSAFRTPPHPPTRPTAHDDYGLRDDYH